jgi:hypothetical protein
VDGLPPLAVVTPVHSKMQSVLEPITFSIPALSAQSSSNSCLLIVAATGTRVFLLKRPSSRFDELANGRFDGRFGARRRAQLRASIIEMKIDRPLRQPEHLRYFR